VSAARLPRCLLPFAPLAAAAAAGRDTWPPQPFCLPAWAATTQTCIVRCTCSVRSRSSPSQSCAPPAPRPPARHPPPRRSTWAGRSVIRSCAKLAYPHVQSMIEGQFLGGLCLAGGGGGGDVRQVSCEL
jgi:hypothetical protein